MLEDHLADNIKEKDIGQCQESNLGLQSSRIGDLTSKLHCYLSRLMKGDLKSE